MIQYKKILSLAVMSTALTVFSVRSMELQKDSLLEKIPLNDTNHTLITYFQKLLPPELKHAIICLFTELVLNYDFELSEELPLEEVKTNGLGKPGILGAAALSPDGDMVLIAGLTGLCLWNNVVTGKRIRELKGFTGNLYAGAFSPNGETVIAGSSDGIAYLWDTKIGELVFQLEHIDPIYAVAFSPDGTTVLTVSINGRARLWDAKSGTALMALYEYRDFVLRGTPEGVPVQPTRPCMLAGFSADGTLIFTSRYQESIAYIWDAHSGKLVRRLYLVDFGRDMYLKFYSGALSPQGNVLLTNMPFAPKYAEQEHGAIIWDVKTGKSLDFLLEGHTQDVTSVAFSPDGTTLLTGSEDNTACLWDSLTGKQLKVLDCTANVILVAFSKDGNSIFTLSSDNKMRIWKRSVAKVTSDVATRMFSAWNCFKEFYYLLLYQGNIEGLISPQKAILSFTEAINLDDDSQKECSIQ